MTTCAYFVACVEYERGWGSKVDGYLAFRDQATADKYIAKSMGERTNEAVPDYYTNYNPVGYHPVTAKVEQGIIAAGDGFFYFEHVEDANK
jgi:hypothetical protein